MTDGGADSLADDGHGAALADVLARAGAGLRAARGGGAGRGQPAAPRRGAAVPGARARAGLRQRAGVAGMALRSAAVVDPGAGRGGAGRSGRARSRQARSVRARGGAALLRALARGAGGDVRLRPPRLRRGVGPCRADRRYGLVRAGGTRAEAVHGIRGHGRADAAARGRRQTTAGQPMGGVDRGLARRRDRGVAGAVRAARAARAGVRLAARNGGGAKGPGAGDPGSGGSGGDRRRRALGRRPLPLVPCLRRLERGDAALRRDAALARRALVPAGHRGAGAAGAGAGGPPVAALRLAAGPRGPCWSRCISCRDTRNTASSSPWRRSG